MDQVIQLCNWFYIHPLRFFKWMRCYFMMCSGDLLLVQRWADREWQCRWGPAYLEASASPMSTRAARPPGGSGMRGFTCLYMSWVWDWDCQQRFKTLDQTKLQKGYIGVTLSLSHLLGSFCHFVIGLSANFCVTVFIQNVCFQF